MATLLFEIWKRKWLLAAFAIGTLIAILPTPEGLSREGLIILGISAGALVIYITEPIPLPTVALLIAILQVVFGIATPKAVAQSYMSDSVFFIMGSLMIAVAFVKQKLDRRIAYFLLKVTGGETKTFALGIMVAGGLIASLIGEHTVAAILLPVCVVVIRAVNEREGEDRELTTMLLLSLAFGCTIAGIGTPSGGARNAIMIQYWNDFSNIRIGYLDWVIAAYPLLFLILPVMWFIMSSNIKPRTKTLGWVTARLGSEVHKAGALGGKDWLTIGIFLLTLVLWLTTSATIGLGIVALIGASLYLMTGCVDWQDLNSGVNWGAVLLYAAAMSMGVAMVKWGAAKWLANNFMSALGAVGLGEGIGLLISVALLIMLVTNTMSSGAAVAVMAPVTLEIAKISGEHVIVMGFITAMASAFGFMSVASHPGMTIVYSCGYLPAKVFLKHGWKIALAAVIILTIYSATYLSWIAPAIGHRGTLP